MRSLVLCIVGLTGLACTLANPTSGDPGTPDATTTSAGTTSTTGDAPPQADVSVSTSLDDTSESSSNDPTRISPISVIGGSLVISGGVESGDRIEFVDDAEPVPSVADAAVPGTDGLVVGVDEQLVMAGGLAPLVYAGIHVEGDLTLTSEATFDVPRGDVVISGLFRGGATFLCTGQDQRVLITGRVLAAFGHVKFKDCAHIAVQGGAIEARRFVALEATSTLTLGPGASLGSNTSAAVADPAPIVLLLAPRIAIAGSVQGLTGLGGEVPNVEIRARTISVGATTELGSLGGAEGWLLIGGETVTLAAGARLTVPGGQITAEVTELVDQGALVDDLDGMIEVQ